MVMEEARVGIVMVITAYSQPLVNAPSFKYLGRILLASGDDFLALFHNHRMDRKKWARLMQVLGREGG